MKFLKIIMGLVLAVMLSGCSAVPQDSEESNVFFIDSVYVYTAGEQQRMLLDNLERFDELRTMIAQSEYSSVYVRQNSQTGEYTLRASKQGEVGKAKLNEEITAAMVLFLSDFHCESIMCGGGKMQVKFWDGLGISEIEYLEKEPSGIGADSYIKLTEHWYYGEFPYDIVY